MDTFDLPQGVTENTISLLLGHPDPSTLLTAELRTSMQRVINDPQAYATLQYGAEQGTRGLINVLVEKIRREQQISIGPENLMVVAGSTHAVDMLARLYTKPGGVVLIEAPTYVDSIHIFKDHHVELHSIPMDDEGILTDELEQQLIRLHASGHTPSMLYTIPNFHNPAGSTLSEARRREIIRLAHHYGFLIVEDDVYRDLSFEGPVPPSFYALADGKQVFSIGSFSKTLAPGLRLGWLLGSDGAIQRCVNCGTTQMGGGANPLSAQMVAEYCRTGHFERHVLQMRALYKTRRDVLLSALERYMPIDVRWTHPAGGFFVWLTLPENIFAPEVKRLALQKGVALATGENFFLNPADGEHNLRLAYSCAAYNDIDTAINILAQVIESAKRARRRRRERDI
jgi:2-aminoadipate transaminase